MKVTLNQILVAELALGRLIQERLPIKAAYWLSKLVKLAGAEIQAFHDQRNSLIKEFGEEKDGNWTLDPTSEKFPEFRAKLEELLSIHIDLPWSPLDFDLLGDVNITAQDLLHMEPFLSSTETPKE